MTTGFKRKSVFALVLGLLSCVFSVSVANASDDILIEEMNELAQTAMQVGMDALVQANTLYPFAIVRMMNGKVSMITYQGKHEDAPSAEDWAQVMFFRVREMAKKNENISSAVIAKLHEVNHDELGKIPGIWTQVDHRYARSMIVFLPLIPNEEGNHTMGELIYYATEQQIFAD